MSESEQTNFTCTVSLTWESNDNTAVAAAIASKYGSSPPSRPGQHSFQIGFNPFGVDGALTRAALDAAGDALRSLIGTRHSVEIAAHLADDRATCVLVGGQYRLCHNHTLALNGQPAEVDLNGVGVQIEAYVCAPVSYCELTFPNTFIP